MKSTNEDATGQIRGANNGLKPRARASSPNEGAEGQRAVANGLEISAIPPSPNEDAEGQGNHANKCRDFAATASSPKASRKEGHRGVADKANDRTPFPARDPKADGGGHAMHSDKAIALMPSTVRPTIDEIRAWHRQRCFAMEQRKRANLSLGSYLRSCLGWRLDNDEKVNAKIRKLANDLIKCGEKIDAGKKHELENSPEFQKHGVTIMAAIQSRGPWDGIEEDAVEHMEALATLLPVYAFCEPIRGVGALSLAVIIGEAGDLGDYPNHSKLWKRMGLAVMDGVRQGGLGKNASKDAWIEHGYNRQRRSRMWVIGDSLIKSNKDGVYRALYLKRKAYEIAREPEMKPIKAHRRAQRYMEKRFLRDLWRKWRARSLVAEMPLEVLPATTVCSQEQRDGQSSASERPYADRRRALITEAEA